MKITSIKINNYKSLGDTNTRIDIEDITTIVGKNETGKSNIVNCLGYIKNFYDVDKQMFSQKRINSNNEVEVSMVMNLYDFEKTKYDFKEDTKITLNSSNTIKIEGGITTYFKENKLYNKHLQILNQKSSYITKLNSKDSQAPINLEKYIQYFNKAGQQYLTFYLGEINNIKKMLEVDLSNILESFNYCINTIIDIYELIPEFIKVKDITLKSKYTKVELEDKTKTDEMLKYMLEMSELSIDDILEYFSYTQSDRQVNIQDKINRKLATISESFNKFYTQEEIHLSVHFNNNSMNIVVNSSKGDKINFSERSDGLKWYFNMYIQMMYNRKNIEMNNKVILIDEPGTRLHIDAQKELLNLFETITDKNQIIYTTHSVFMIYEKKLNRIKKVYKTEEGISIIENKYYSSSNMIDEVSNKETLSPILSALGMKMSYNIFGYEQGKIHIITEGISDYNYLKAYLCMKGKENSYVIVPSISATNVHNIASILISWGIEFKILFDQDKTGREEYMKIIKSGLTSKENMLFIDGQKECDNSKIITIEDIISAKDKEKIGISNQDYKSKKAINSQYILLQTQEGNFKYDVETQKNFKKIIDIIKEEDI